MAAQQSLLTRRTMLKRLAWAGSGASAVLLVGCGEPNDQPAPQPQRAVESQAAQPVQQSGRQPALQQPEPRARPPLSQAAQPVQQAAQPQQIQAQAVKQEAAPRRRLAADLSCVACEIEDPEFTPLSGARADWGVLEGAGYRIEVPDNWNGSLVLWAHGFTGLNEAGTAATERLSFESPPRELLIGLGYGWAASTYRAAGYVPGLGVDDLLLVKDRAAALFGRPSRTFCVGASMGGATAQLMAQEFPEELAGAIAFCGALGNVWVTDYLTAWHTLALWFIGSPPLLVNAAGLIEWGRALGSRDGDGGFQLTPAGEQFAAVIEQLTGGPRWGFREGLAAQWETSFAVGALIWPSLIGSTPFAPGQVIDLGGGLIPSDTSRFEFAVGEAVDLGLDLERLNAEVVRIASSPARRADPGTGEPSGRLEVPLLCMKTTGDLFTPIHLDRDYQRLVAEAGYSRNLVVRAIRRAGHCTFEESETLAAMAAMLSWIEFGARPAGENLSGSLQSAGELFTQTFDPNDPLRPADR